MLSARLSILSRIPWGRTSPGTGRSTSRQGESESHFPIHIGFYPLVSYVVGVLAAVHRKDQRLWGPYVAHFPFLVFEYQHDARAVPRLPPVFRLYYLKNSQRKVPLFLYLLSFYWFEINCRCLPCCVHLPSLFHLFIPSASVQLGSHRAGWWLTHMDDGSSVIYPHGEFSATFPQ